jgi:hypothetical protein
MTFETNFEGSKAGGALECLLGGAVDGGLLSFGESGNITKMKSASGLETFEGLPAAGFVYKVKSQFCAGDRIDGTGRRFGYATVFSSSEHLAKLPTLPKSAGRIFGHFLQQLFYYNYVFYSSEELCGELGLTRKTLSKSLGVLKEERFISEVKFERRDLGTVQTLFVRVMGREMPPKTKWFKISTDFCWKGNFKYNLEPPEHYKLLNRNEAMTRVVRLYGWPTLFDSLMEEVYFGKWMPKQYKMIGLDSA